MESENPGLPACECVYRLQLDLMGLRITKPRIRIPILDVFAGNRTKTESGNPV